MTRRPPHRLLLATLAALVVGCYGPLPEIPQVATPASSAASTPPTDPRDPGRVTIHRLNRAEYDRTVRDLLGARRQPAEDFPADDHGHGFDNNADVLSLSPLLLELYERAASDLIGEALREPLTEPAVLRVEAEEADDIQGLTSVGVGVVLLAADSRITHVVQAPLDGPYRFAVRAWAEPSDEEPVQMRLIVGTREVGVIDVTATADSPDVYSVALDVSEGPTPLAVELANPSEGFAGLPRTLTVDYVELEGPLDLVVPAPGEPDARERLLVCTPTSPSDVGCARQVVATFASRAWRRPVEADEVDRLMPLFALALEEGLGFVDAVAVPLTAVLVSPHFLFRVEVDPDDAPRLLTDHELATRLSYFLWSSMPDDALRAAADAGRLQDPAVLAAETERMLDDPRAEALVANFAGQWLQTRHLADIAPDAWFFPDFDEPLRAAMRQEVELFFRTFIDRPRPLSDMLLATDSFVDDRLAAHYGMAPVGPGTSKVDLSTVDRGGLLRMAGLLTVLAYPTRTSPVKRGQWVLEELLCEEVPAPPPGVEGLIEADADAKTLRDRLEKHRADPMCASCHDAMDPIGLGLESYDGIGTYRVSDAGYRVDTAGVLFGGAAFAGADELIGLLAADPRFPDCVTEKVFTYALGRGPVKTDSPYLHAIARQLDGADSSLRDVIREVVLSGPFRMRRGAPEEASP